MKRLNLNKAKLLVAEYIDLDEWDVYSWKKLGQAVCGHLNRPVPASFVRDSQTARIAILRFLKEQQLKSSPHHLKPKPKPKPKFKPSFYTTNKWRKLRYKAFELYGNKCNCCGSTYKLHVDHIKPRSKYPELQYDIHNLQILCEECNKGKSADYETDWRQENSCGSGPVLLH